MHGLKIFALVPIGNREVQAANFRREGVSSGPAAHHAGTQFLAVLHHEQAVVRQTADHAVGTVDDQAAAGLLELFQQVGIGVIVAMSASCNGVMNVFVGLTSSPNRVWV
jgi:hypothetical protein